MLVRGWLLWRLRFDQSFLFPNISSNDIWELEAQMGKHFNCYPGFDDMEFYEFIAKYDKLREMLKKDSGKQSLTDVLAKFKSMM